MESPSSCSSHISTRSANSGRSPDGPTVAPARRFAPCKGAGRTRPITLSSAANARRLIADEQYFGLEARELRAGAARALARISKQRPEPAWIDIHSPGNDFKLDDALAGEALLSAFLTAGFLHPDGTGAYRPTDILREYAAACVVGPLPRARAKALIIRACRQAVRINFDFGSESIPD